MLYDKYKERGLEILISLATSSDIRLRGQLCFPLYACAKEVVRRYTPLLEPLGLTYTQYIAMMVMWEYKSISVRDMLQRLTK